MPAMVDYSVTNRIALITINRPQVRNAIDLATAIALSAALDRLDADRDARAGVLTGSGAVFCAGMDLRAINSGQPRPQTESRGMFGICEKPPLKPLIAAVEGAALGGGLEVALACDLIVVAQDAKLGLPEVRRGLVAGAGGLLRLPRKLPRAVALEISLTGELLPTSRALELGLVNRVCEAGEAAAVASALAGRIAEGAPMAVTATKQLIEESVDWSLTEAFERQLPIVQAVRDSEDAREGAAAFVEKRAPVWRGH